jgi:hypothetical protein
MPFGSALSCVYFFMESKIYEKAQYLQADVFQIFDETGGPNVAQGLAQQKDAETGAPRISVRSA